MSGMIGKHTPGPWMVQNGKIVEQCYNGFTIADVKGATEVMQDDANAKLNGRRTGAFKLHKGMSRDVQGLERRHGKSDRKR